MTVEDTPKELWGGETRKAVDNFPVSGERVPVAVVRWLGRIKGAAARANTELGLLDAELAERIAVAGDEIAVGEHDDHFPIDVFQTGSGTSTNMNVNEVIATLAGRAGVEVHPNDHVNAAQSSNDTFPSAIHVAAVLADAVKSGRTHLMDATPVTLGQEMRGYAAVVDRARERIEAVLPRVRELPLGGTAVGTGINAPRGFAEQTIARLNAATGERFTEARDHFEAQGGRDAIVELSGALRTYAIGLVKICNDLRWMASGPTAGLAEIRLPDLQPGSSIMPGKVNPVIPEATLMVCAQVIGNDAAIVFAGASGSFELNVMLPVIARNILESERLLATSSRLLAACVDGITADRDRMHRYAESSPSVVTPLNKYVGYEEASRVAKESLKAGRTIREQVLAMGYVDRGVLTLEQLDTALDV